MKHAGFTNKIKELLPSTVDESELGRIIAEHKERYILQAPDGTFNAEITGNLRFTAETRADFPAVGDWVRFIKMDDENAIIVELFQRYSVLERQAVGKTGEIQIIASNIDYAFIVQSVGHDFNLKRLDRYLTLCYNAHIEPIIVLSKTDLVARNETETLIKQLKERVNKVSIIALSSENMQGYDTILTRMKPNRTYCFIGSSGVGKSTIINHLKNEDVLKTAAISSSTGKGRHTTSHRELLVLPNGSIVIDTPGMRELGITDQSEGIEMTYDQISALGRTCRYKDCRHINETGCAVLQAIEDGSLLQEVYDNYQKLKREQEHFSSALHEKRQRDKDFGKMIKSVLHEKRKQKDR